MQSVTVGALVDLLLSNWQLTLAGIVLGALAYWYYAESDTGSTRGDTLDAVGDRAQGAVGGIMSGTRAVLLSLLAIIGTIAAEAMQLGADLNNLLGATPLFLGHIAYGALSWFGIDLGISQRRLGMAFAGITIIAVVWAAAAAASRRRSYG